MQTEEENLIEVPDLDQKRCVNALRRLRRKGFDTSRVWCVGQTTGGRITRSLVVPESYCDALTPMMRSAAVKFNGKLR